MTCISYGLPKALSTIIEEQSSKGQYALVYKTIKCSFLFAVLTGGIIALALFFGADIIATYFVNAVVDGDKIKIYERVAFIKLGNDYLYFYKDYNMNDLVYKLKVTYNLDQSFINNESIVSNVLLKYQDEFDLYEYNYVKGEDSYYIESIER